MQNDFCPGGSLPVPEGDEIVPILNKCLNIFSKAKLSIFISRDWHPEKTKHFKKFGGNWPIHCAQNTKGSEFYPELKLLPHAVILSKGVDPKKDSYLAFQATDFNGMEFANIFKIFGIKELFVGGLATDYCVKWSVLDAIRFGFKVNLLSDGIKGVNLKKGDAGDALKEMVKSGAKKLTFESVAGKI